MAEQTVHLRTGSPIDFVEQVLKLGSEGYTLQENTFPRLKGFPITASFVIETDKSVEVNPEFLHTIPLPLGVQVYTKEELENMPIEDIRPILAAWGVKGRAKDKMIRQYLEAVESGKVCEDDSVEDEEDIN